jgi:hypothetical protein
MAAKAEKPYPNIDGKSAFLISAGPVQRRAASIVGGVQATHARVNSITDFVCAICGTQPAFAISLADHEQQESGNSLDVSHCASLQEVRWGYKTLHC